MQNNLEIAHEQFRSLVVASLARGAGGQLASLYVAVGNEAGKRGLLPTHTNTGQIWRSSGGDDNLTSRDRGRVQGVFWDLVIEGIVRPGLGDGMNESLPFFRVTERGEEFLKDPDNPYDPDGYLQKLREKSPEVDEIVIAYLNESLRAFRIGCLMSSTITLGCASEKAMLLLIDAYGSYLTIDAAEKFRKSVEGRMIKRQVDELKKRIDSQLKAELPPQLRDNIETSLSGIFEFIRQQRNEAGHPTGRTFSREEAYANLVVFPHYAKTVYELITWLRTNPQNRN